MKNMYYNKISMTIKESFKKNAFALVVLSFILLIVTGFILQIYFIRNVRHFQKTSKMQSIKSAYNELTNKYIQLAEGILTFIVNNNKLKTSFINKNRRGLYNGLKKSFSEIKKKTGIKQLHFHLKGGVSFLRMHLPEKYGDNLYAQRPMVYFAQKNITKVSGIELGYGGLGFRVIIPIMHRGKLFGTVEVGSGFKKSFFDDFSSHTQTLFALFVLDKRKKDGISLIYSQFEVFKYISKNQIIKIKEKNYSCAIEKSSKTSCDYFSFPVLAYNKKIAGFIVSSANCENSFYDTRRQITFSVVIYIIEIMFILIISFLWIKIRKLNSALNSKNTFINNLVKKKDKFISIISHDIRAPFANIIGYSELLKNSKELTGKNMQYVEMINKSVKHQLDYVDELLELIRYDYDDIILKKEEFNITNAVKECAEYFKVTAEAKEIKIEIEVNEDILIIADKNKIIQVINNLISNAIKFTQRQGKIEVKCFKNKALETEIHIKDNGVGIPEEEIDSIFEEGSKYHIKGTEGEKTIGLGLLICNKIISLHEGKIVVESRESEGSDFAVILK
jgi:signal transduction histidine kinase